MSILVFGISLDPHLSAVVNKLDDQYGVSSYMVDQSGPIGVQLELSSDGNISLLGNDLPADELRLVWNRHKLALPIAGAGEAYRAEYVAKAQWTGFSQGIAEALGLRIINLPTSGLSSKFGQLVLASSCGFRIPYTLVPTSKDKVLVELRRGRSFVIKSLAYPNTPVGDYTESLKAIMTSRISERELEQLDEAQLLVCPHFLQEEINKKCELRVIATFHRYYAFSTYAHEEELTEVDWRYGNAYLEFIEFELRESLYEQIKQYLKAMGLVYGVFDFIVDQDDQEWFLECNTEGQWHWLEAKYGAAISSGIAEALFKVWECTASTRYPTGDKGVGLVRPGFLEDSIP